MPRFGHNREGISSTLLNTPQIASNLRAKNSVEAKFSKLLGRPVSLSFDLDDWFSRLLGYDLDINTQEDL